MKDKEKLFQTIIANYQNMIYRLCCSYIADDQIRKDLYQNILIRLWRGLESFQNHSSMGTWVYRIAVNTSLDFLRKEIKNRSRSMQMDLENLAISDKSPNQEEELLISEKTELLYRCINRFSFIDKTIISLYLEDLSYREIAHIVGITEKNVSVKISRIKKNLSKCLKDI
jgi:RNA polymerase sigma-70 factor (ECF subfamily)